MKKEVLLIVIPVLILLTVAFFFRGDITGLVTGEERFRVVVVLKASDDAFIGAAVADTEVNTQEAIDAMKVKTAVVQSEVISDVNSGGLFSFAQADDVVVEKKYAVVPAMVVYVTEDGLIDLLNNPLVEGVYSDYSFSVGLSDSVPLINGTDIDFGVFNQNVSVCVIDTGIDITHSAFEDRIIAQHCYCSNDCCPNSQSEDTNAMDDNIVSHGTHVSGIIASNGTKKGVAPDANIVAVKVCNDQGSCFTSDVISGIDFCVQNKAAYNIQVISGSIGDGGQHIPASCPTFIDSALDAAAALDMFLVFASGNDGYTGGINYPACYPNAVSVAASTKSDTMASFSNRGLGLDLVAPGVSIVSTTIGNNYGTLSGTSQATPHVSGFIALLLDFAERFNLSRQNVVDSMNKTNLFIEGFPRINVGQALGYLAGLANYTLPIPPVVNNVPELIVVSPVNNSQILNPISFAASAIDVEDGDLNVSWFLINETYYGNFSLNLFEGNYSITASAVDLDNATKSIEILFEVINQTIPSVDNPPVVEILSHSNNSFVGKNITLIGSISDEDNLTGEWSSNIQGSLGAGNEINVLLSEGSHMISFSAVDSANQTSVSSIVLEIGSCLIDFDKNLNAQLDIGDVLVLFNEFLNNSLTDSSGTFCSQSGTCLIEFDRNFNSIYDIGDIVLLFNGFLNNNITKPSGENCFN